MKSEIQVLCKDSGELFSSFPIDQDQKAYEFAKTLEDQGFDVQVRRPSTPETLIMELGASETDQEELKEELNQEIDSHDSCCYNNQGE